MVVGQKDESFVQTPDEAISAIQEQQRPKQTSQALHEDGGYIGKTTK
jgi:hypothetical protein